MSRTPLAQEAKRALASRLEYYRELGIYDFYRRGSSAAGSEESWLSAADRDATPAASLPQVISSSSSSLQASAALSGGDASAALRAIREDIGDCKRCRLHSGRKNIVFGVGDPRAELMFVGEAPGADEDERGEPFVGRGGQLLNNMIAAMGVRRKEVYIANIIKCRPPSNRTPERDECETCSPFLLRQIEAIHPKIIVALGAVAARTLLGINDSMANLRGRVYDFRGTKLVVSYHPAFLLRDPRQKKEAWKDLQLVMQYLGLPLPAALSQTQSQPQPPPK
jgi:uracil-DNA glycosylase